MVASDVAQGRGSALMSIKRGCSLIDYTQAYGDIHDVKWSEPQ